MIPNHPLIKSGIYKYFKHPNYLGVILEIAFIPLIYSAFATSIIWSIANIFLLRHRIRLEEKVFPEGVQKPTANKTDPEREADQR